MVQTILRSIVDWSWGGWLPRHDTASAFILFELERRGCTIDCVRTREGHEVDFLDRAPDGQASLIQVCAEVSDPGTHDREVRALAAAATEYPDAMPLLLTFDSLPPRLPIPFRLRWQPAVAWLLGDEPPRPADR